MKTVVFFNFETLLALPVLGLLGKGYHILNNPSKRILLNWTNLFWMGPRFYCVHWNISYCEIFFHNSIWYLIFLLYWNFIILAFIIVRLYSIWTFASYCWGSHAVSPNLLDKTNWICSRLVSIAHFIWKLFGFKMLSCKQKLLLRQGLGRGSGWVTLSQVRRFTVLTKDILF
jgi:hypothetical protein